MARHEVVFQDFTELAARLGLDAETLTNGGTEEERVAEQEPALTPELRQPDDPGQSAAWIAPAGHPDAERPEPKVRAEPDDESFASAPTTAQGELAQLLAELAAASAALAAAARQDETARSAASAPAPSWSTAGPTPGPCSASPPTRRRSTWRAGPCRSWGRCSNATACPAPGPPVPPPWTPRPPAWRRTRPERTRRRRAG
jgi:hypothetical protein